MLYKPSGLFDQTRNMNRQLIDMGQILQQVKELKEFKAEDYGSFREYVMSEYNLTAAMANNLAKIYQLFCVSLQIDVEQIKSIGYERLRLIYPIVSMLTVPGAIAEWIQLAGMKDAFALEELVKKCLKEEKEKAKTFKDIFTEQWVEQMKELLSMGGTLTTKELHFLLALYFQKQNLEEVHNIIIAGKRRFAQEVEEAERKAEEAKINSNTIITEEPDPDGKALCFGTTYLNINSPINHVDDQVAESADKYETETGRDKQGLTKTNENGGD